MQKTPRVAALERMVQHYEKCRTDLTLLDQQLRAASGGDDLEDILALHAQTIEAANRSLHVAYARLEREQTRSITSSSRASSAPAFAVLSPA